MEDNLIEDNLMEIENLSITYFDNKTQTKAVKDVNINLKMGQTIGIIGESGSGKTSIANAIMQILPKNTKCSGSIKYKDKEILNMSEKERTSILWEEISIIFQNSLDVLNPVMTVGDQIREVLVEHKKIDKISAKKISEEYIEKVGLKKEVYDMYPHELSGGMRQRILIAMGIVCRPKLLIADELTSALDAKTKSEILKLIKVLQKELNFSLLLISHELDTVSILTEELIVLYKGEVMEQGITKEILNYQYHPYTRGLINSSTAINIYKDLWGIPNKKDMENIDLEDSCPFYKRCTQRIEICGEQRVKLESIVDNREIACHRNGIIELLKCENIDKTYKNKKSEINACIGCSLSIRHGEFISIVGESGSGKTTLASILSGILKPDVGSVYFKKEEVIDNNLGTGIEKVQIVFQDPFTSINEKFSILDAVSEPLIINKKIVKNKSKEGIKELVKRELEKVELENSDEYLERKIHTLSGGQRQRVALARALIMKPQLLIGDEICSMLDKSTEANILRLLKKLQNEEGFAMIYITHNLGVALKLSDRIAVMNEGRIIEEGNTIQIMKNPKHSYTKELIHLNEENETLLY